MHRFRSSPKSRRLSQGFTFLELMVVMGVSALLAVYAFAELNNKSEESLAQAAAVYLSEVGKASRDYTLVNFESLATGVDVPGVALDLAPTLAELVTTGRLPARFPTAAGSVPGQLSVGITMRLENCPGPNCLIGALVCTTTPVTLGGGGTRFDLASTMTTAQGGTGGQSLFGAGNVIRGPLVNEPNPMGDVPGIVCNGATVTTAEFERFVRIRDTRDPDLKGPLTVEGLVTLKNDLTATGSATLGGKVTGDRFRPSGQYAVDAVCTDSDEGSIARRSGTTAGLVVCLGKKWKAMQPAMAELGGVCTQEGSVATASSSEQLLCVAGEYRGMSTIVRAGKPDAACTNAGTTAIDTANNNETLVCRLNPSGGTQRYMRLRDVTQHLSFVRAVEVAHGSVITRPTCAGAEGTFPISIVQLIPKTFSSSNGGVDIRVTETPTEWTVVMRDGIKDPKNPKDVGSPLAGQSVSIAQVFCYYP